MELLQIKKLNTAIERVMNQEMAKIGLTYTQSSVIGFLIENMDKDIYQKDIEYSLGLTHPTVSSILKRMETSGLITSAFNGSDRRYKKIVLTHETSQLYQEISSVYNRVKTRLFSEMSPEQRELFNVTVKTMLKNVK